MDDDEGRDAPALDPAVENAVDAAVAESVEATEAVERVTGESEPIETSSAVAAALMRLNEAQVATQNMLVAQQALLRENLAALSRAQETTDIAAQRAAASTEHLAEAIEPPKAGTPDTVQPANIKELPTKERQAAAARSRWFGKAANRHGGQG